jgi:hypothetical protein
MIKIRTVDEAGNIQEVEEVTEEKAPNYLEVYATGIEGGPFGPWDFRMNFFDQTVEKDKTGKLIVKKAYKAKVIVSYAAAKQLALWLDKHLALYEKNSGHEIYMGDEKSKDAE